MLTRGECSDMEAANSAICWLPVVARAGAAPSGVAGCGQPPRGLTGGGAAEAARGLTGGSVPRARASAKRGEEAPGVTLPGPGGGRGTPAKRMEGAAAPSRPPPPARGDGVPCGPRGGARACERPVGWAPALQRCRTGGCQLPTGCMYEGSGAACRWWADSREHAGDRLRV